MNLGDVHPPTKKAAGAARAAAKALAPLLGAKGGVPARILLRSHERRQEVVVPHEALELLVEILQQMALGNGVTVTPVRAELTIGEAAALLNVSRPHVAGLLDCGDIPLSTAGARGTHRRIWLRDLLEYKRRDDAKRRKAAQVLTREAQDLRLGY